MIPAPKKSSPRLRRRLHLVVDNTDARPVRRADCVDGPRPCPWVSCAHHLYLDVDAEGMMKLNFRGLAPSELTTSCALDVIDRNPGGASYEDVSSALSVSRQYVQEVEARALKKLTRTLRRLGTTDAHAFRELFSSASGASLSVDRFGMTRKSKGDE